MSPGELGPELERLPGVLAATVFPDPDVGARVYLAVHDDADRDAVRATTLALCRDRGLATDPDRIHIGTATTHPPTPTALPTLSFDAIDVHRTENRVECTVRLRVGTRTTTGIATEPDSPAGRARAAARATLAAAESLDPDLRLGLHGARTSDLFGSDSLSVLVEASSGRTHIPLPGIALVEQSLEHAGALAALNALRSWTP
ncbi:MAG: hypothetical protein R6U63_09185 [Longimicrobiales bacterium]